jgi:hypothetical protein
MPGPRPPLSALGIVEIVVRGFMAAGGSSITPAINVWNFRRTVLSSTLVKSQINTAFQAAIMAPLKLAANIRYTPSALTIRFIEDAVDFPQQFSIAGVGNVATDSAPSDDSVVLYLQTGLRGRSYRGFKHLPGLNEIDTTQDILTGAGLVRWQAVQAAVLAGFTDAGGNVWVPSVVSRSLCQLKLNPTTVVANDVNAVSLDTVVGTMRKRKAAQIRV